LLREIVVLSPLATALEGHWSRLATTDLHSSETILQLKLLGCWWWWWCQTGIGGRANRPSNRRPPPKLLLTCPHIPSSSKQTKCLPSSSLRNLARLDS